MYCLQIHDNAIVVFLGNEIENVFDFVFLIGVAELCELVNLWDAGGPMHVAPPPKALCVSLYGFKIIARTRRDARVWIRAEPRWRFPRKGGTCVRLSRRGSTEREYSSRTHTHTHNL